MATESPHPHSRAYVEEQILLRSDEAQHVAKRAGPQAIVSLQKIAVVLGYITKEKQIAEVEELIDKAIDRTATTIAAEMARVQKLIADNGITVSPQFNHPVTITVALTTPAAVAYYGLIRQLDELMFLIHQLWFGRVWDNRQRRMAGIEWQRKLVALATNINQTEQRAWKAFEKKGRSDEPQKTVVGDLPSENAPDPAPAAAPETASAGAVPSEPTTLPALATADTESADPTIAPGKPARRNKSVAA